MVLTQLVMIAIMTMTPVHLTDHGHSTQATGLVIGLHVGAMFLPSPADRSARGPGRPAAGWPPLRAVTLAAAGGLAALAPPPAVGPALATALALLGLGWNIGLVSGTAMVTDSASGAHASTQGLVDVGMSIAGATGGAVSGLVVAGLGYPVLAVAGGVLALAVIPLTARAARPQAG